MSEQTKAIKAKIAPILEKLVNHLLAKKPEDPVSLINPKIGHMIYFLETYGKPETHSKDELSKEEKAELKHLRSWFKHLKSKVKEEEKQEKSQSDTESESDDEVDDLPANPSQAK